MSTPQQRPEEIAAQEMQLVEEKKKLLEASKDADFERVQATRFHSNSIA